MPWIVCAWARAIKRGASPIRTCRVADGWCFSSAAASPMTTSVTPTASLTLAAKGPPDPTPDIADERTQVDALTLCGCLSSGIQEP
jgi:hypothetical protein